MKHIIKALTLFTVLAAILSACATAGNEAVPPVDNTPTTEVDQPEPTTTPEDAIDPLKAIKEYLNEKYGVDPEEVVLIKQEAREWTDGCLGLGRPEEGCMAVITPGYLVVVQTPQGSFTFHTETALDIFREYTVDESDPLKAIKLFLYSSYGIAPEDVKLVTQEEREWTDSCLGLGRPEEGCMVITTPGYLVVVETPQGTFTFHTETSLDIFRLEDGLYEEEPSRMDPFAKFRWLLAGRLNVPFEQITIVSNEAVDWPDACLGVEVYGEMCAQVITPGYKITLSTPVGEVVIHTNADLSYWRSPQPLPGEDRPLLVWERSGGIAGICERLTVEFDGAYQITKCNGEIVAENMMDITDYESLIGLVATYEPTEWKFTPPAGSADMFTDGYTFNGAGSEKADSKQQESLNETFSELVQYLKTQPTDR